jgi:hypothetical protein
MLKCLVAALTVSVLLLAALASVMQKTSWQQDFICKRAKFALHFMINIACIAIQGYQTWCHLHATLMLH